MNKQILLQEKRPESVYLGVRLAHAFDEDLFETNVLPDLSFDQAFRLSKKHLMTYDRKAAKRLDTLLKGEYQIQSLVNDSSAGPYISRYEKVGSLGKQGGTIILTSRLESG